MGEDLDRGSTAQREKSAKTNTRVDGARACISKVPRWTRGAPALENWIVADVIVVRRLVDVHFSGKFGG